jgi:hypothetical protein
VVDVVDVVDVVGVVVVVVPHVGVKPPTLSVAFTPLASRLAKPLTLLERFAYCVHGLNPAACMVIVQLDWPAASTAPLTVRVADVPVVVTTAVPPHVFTTLPLTTLPTINPAGKLSTKDIPDWAGLPEVFVMVKVSVLTVLRGVNVGLNAFVSFGTAATAHCCAPTADATVNDELRPEVSTPLTPETLLAPLVYVAQVDVTPCSVMVHEPVGVAIAAPLTTSTLPVNVAVPPQLLLAGPE